VKDVTAAKAGAAAKAVPATTTLKPVTLLQPPRIALGPGCLLVNSPRLPTQADAEGIYRSAL
jgi:hypothetical protein